MKFQIIHAILNLNISKTIKDTQTMLGIFKKVNFQRIQKLQNITGVSFKKNYFIAKLRIPRTIKKIVIAPKFAIIYQAIFKFKPTFYLQY